MEEKDILSIWLGNFESEEKFQEFISENYDDDGDVSSLFTKLFNIDYIDTDFQESLFNEMLTVDDLLQASYAESFIDKIDVDIIKQSNCALIIYDYNYSGEIKSSGNLNFIGTFEYRK